MMNAWHTVASTMMLISTVALTAATPGCGSSIEGGVGGGGAGGGGAGGSTAVPCESANGGEPCETPGERCGWLDECGGILTECRLDHTWGQVAVDEPFCPGQSPQYPCAQYGSMEACQADFGCRWLTPASCGNGPLVQTGCYRVADCTPGSCPAGQTCTLVDYDPCYMAACAACSGSTKVCQ